MLRAWALDPGAGVQIPTLACLLAWQLSYLDLLCLGFLLNNLGIVKVLISCCCEDNRNYKVLRGMSSSQESLTLLLIVIFSTLKHTGSKCYRQQWNLNVLIPRFQ